jgi:hypothetical protein
MSSLRIAVFVVVAVLGMGRVATAQSAAPRGDWKVAVYPILAWVPINIGIDVEVPPGDDTAGGSGSIIDGRFDGAYLGGVSATNDTWRVDASVIWAAVGGDREDTPVLTVDADLIYAYGTVGRAVATDLFITAGVRRLALDYDIKFGNQPNFNRKPGVWDPLVGLAYHKVANKYELHALFEGGGFGVGADVDLGASARVDWKPIPHFGITAGYNMIYFKVKNTVAGRDFTVTQTLHGPVAGIGFYF